MAVVYYVRTRTKRSQGYVLSSSSTVRSGGQVKNGFLSSLNNISGSNNYTTIDHQEKMRKVRQHQQEVADLRAKEGAKKRNEKEAEERERKNNISKIKPSTNNDNNGKRLDGSASNNSGINPVQSWNSTTPSRGNPTV